MLHLSYIADAATGTFWQTASKNIVNVSNPGYLNPVKSVLSVTSDATSEKTSMATGVTCNSGVTSVGVICPCRGSN